MLITKFHKFTRHYKPKSFSRNLPTPGSPDFQYPQIRWTVSWIHRYPDLDILLPRYVVSVEGELLRLEPYGLSLAIVNDRNRLIVIEVSIVELFCDIPINNY